MKIYSVLIMDDQPPVAEKVRCLLSSENDIKIMGVVDNGPEGLRSAKRLKPDIVLMDIRLPDGAEIVREIKRNLPDAVLIVYSGFSLPDHIREALDAGVHGFIAKDVPAESFLAGLRSAIKEGKYPFVLSPHLDLYIDPHQDETATVDNFHLLTPREKEIFLLIAEGWTNSRIAKHLVLSPKTVDSHRTNMMRKLEIHSVRDLIKLAIKKNMISC